MIDHFQKVRLLRELNHPNIVQYKECFIEEGLLITIMEYCEGKLDFRQFFDETSFFRWRFEDKNYKSI